MTTKGVIKGGGGLAAHEKGLAMSMMYVRYIYPLRSVPFVGCCFPVAPCQALGQMASFDVK